MKFLILYIILINLFGLYSMYSDKQKAKKHNWRTPEAILFLISIILGSIGTLSGMYLFHHKTKHIKFVLGMPAILIAHILIFYELFKMKILILKI